MPGIIQLLPDHVANQIAAGEVVQRPASVVKELLENAVDARATDIKLIVKDAGKTLIQVIDNGIGMNVTDARLCFERHATSKIRHAEDLFSLYTKGFRGEALASIAAIAHVELKTRQESDELATHIIIEGSRFVSQDVAVAPRGTAFSVKNLFFNIPARRNFLKSDIVEMRHIVDEFQRVAMAHPGIQFSLYHNASEMFQLPASNLRQRIVNIFSGKTNEKLVPVFEETEIVTLEGFITKPEFAKKNRGEQFFFVNDRFIKSGYLHHAVMSAYDGLLKEGCQPGYFLYLKVPPQTIDINIHPTKTEIKFDDEHALYAILRAAVKHSLGQFNVAPALDFDRDANLDTPYHYKDREAHVPLITVDHDFNPFSNEISARGASGAGLGRPSASSWESLYVGLQPAEHDFSPAVEMTFEKDEISPALFDDATEKIPGRTYQIHRKYIVSPIKSGMVVIDQQRAHQRILYENFLAGMTVKQALSQQLLFPLQLFFTPAEADILRELKPSLNNAGFQLEFLAEDKITISGVPVNVTESEVPIVLEELINDVQNEVPGANFSQSDIIAKSLSRSIAIKTGTALHEREQENIVNSLFACKESDVSPFGKPTFITISVEDLDKKFSV